MDDKLRRKINQKQKYITSEENLKKFGYGKAGFDKHGKQEWILNEERDRIQKIYRESDRGKKTRKRYRESEIGKQKHREEAGKNYKKRKKYIIEWHKTHYERIRQILKKYEKSDKGKKVRSKTNRKAKAKRRELGFRPISFPLECEFDWHHVNEIDVVAMPRWIHSKIYHKLGDGNKLEGIIG